MIAELFKSPLEIASAYSDNTLIPKLKEIRGISNTIAKGFSDFWEGKI